MSRGRRSRSQAQIEEPAEVETRPRTVKKSKNTFSWENYVDEEVLIQLNKLPEPTNLLTQLDSQDWYAELKVTWEYQYFLGWLYNVCDSYITIVNHTTNNSTPGPNGTNKRNILWKDVKFDELTFLQDFINELENIASDPSFNEYGSNDDSTDSNEASDNISLYSLIRLKLLRQISNNKSAALEDWDLIMNHNLQIEDKQVYFDQLSVLQKFKMFYQIIKVIERKNLSFKNYIFTNVDILELFEFNEIIIEENKQSLLILPSIGVIVEKNLKPTVENPELRVPLKLRNCIMKYEDEDSSSVDIVSLDYSEEIDAYLQNFKWEFKVVTSDWGSFIEYMDKLHSENNEVFGFVSPFINAYMDHIVYTRKQFAQREKARAMSELLTRRKRSTRLVAREEETKKKEIENEWETKLDDRELYLKHKHRIVAKYAKTLKDIIWNQLWINFNKDFKISKLKKKDNEMQVTEAITGSQYEGLNCNDVSVIEHGESFKNNVINLSEVIDKDIPLAESSIVREIPADLLISETEIDTIINQGIQASVSKADDPSWLFQCPTCQFVDEEDPATFNKVIKIIKSDEDIVSLLYNRPLICCDLCSRWQHWECQRSEFVELLSWAHTSKNKELHILTQRDLGAVTLDKQNLGSRRSTRKQNTDETNPAYIRPTDIRKPFDDRSVFICTICSSKLEDDLRKIFIPELKAVRNKERKQQENKEKRRKLKEEQKRLKLLQETNNVANNTVSPSTESQTIIDTYTSATVPQTQINTISANSTNISFVPSTEVIPDSNQTTMSLQEEIKSTDN
ncbi:hypothetical protein TPHA_0J00810 [Tetrapisispora phaffii CBS 4417]|uniref:Uncharacterized protein n=1 Tax=Tetrapisispora phaffii (strain ATCC 24235 / CBS 4417 / NBRC 1672 / NRRL Y-8282 / UCD 70-5) TaxID=1071381 RepID=G8BYG2_TETPH|nr:hypothetical protein TPHA_0J00810 [Tetrapisispora phaffii CBS 4417]CCE64904.1 hypothetical protein TPHA_0J00810 [Tetrapisispora phaffii CBS 4417]